MSSFSYSIAESQTFTITHARHIATKVAADLKRMQRLYSGISDSDILDYEQEIIAFLKAGYLDTVTFGFKRDNKWIEPTLRYTASDLYGAIIDDSPGRIPIDADISNATFYSYLTYSKAWNAASYSEKENFKKTLPFIRNGAAEPTINGYLENDRAYSSGGKSLNRATVRNLK